MSTLGLILVASFGGGLLSLCCAAVFAFAARASWVPLLVSYAVGALLGAVFLEILPTAFRMTGDVEGTAATILAGILLFFVLEKLVLWRHCHVEDCEAHELPAHDRGGDHGRSGMMIMVGDTFHNLVDGVIIAAAFIADRELGIVTTVAIIAHEIPQEMGDFVILRHSGFSKARALAFNVVSSLATVGGAVAAYHALNVMQDWVPTLLAIAAASMLYVAVADLIPGLHKRPELKATLQQVLLISLGVGSIYWVHRLLDHAG